MTEYKTITYDVHGEFITQLIREKFYSGERSYEKTIDLLLGCMEGTDTPKEQLIRYAQDILLGRAALKGSTAADTYHLEIFEPGEEHIPASMNIWKEAEERRKVEKKLERMIERWNVVMEHISEETKREIRKELGEETIEDKQQDALKSFMKRMLDKEEHTTEDYGWLEPNGAFHVVEWGDHQEWANNYLKENLTSEEHFTAMVEINASGVAKSSTDIIGAADYLVRRGWVLLHNPSQGIAIPTRDLTRKYTKAQKEFLYDYYMQRKCTREANAIWEG